MDPQAHWERIYQTRQPAELSWYRPHLETSLQLIAEAGAGRNAHIIDIGAGESTLLDDLLAQGYGNLTALDVSATALNVVKARLGPDAARVNWLCGDVRNFPLPARQYDIWHDRAVFHFFTEAEDRAAYVRQVMGAVRPGGRVFVATFGPQGPSQCSGLDVARYDPQALQREFGPGFRLLKDHIEVHRTPAGGTQQFTYCSCLVVDGPVS